MRYVSEVFGYSGTAQCYLCEQHGVALSTCYIVSSSLQTGGVGVGDMGPWRLVSLPVGCLLVYMCQRVCGDRVIKTCGPGKLDPCLWPVGDVPSGEWGSLV